MAVLAGGAAAAAAAAAADGRVEPATPRGAGSGGLGLGHVAAHPLGEQHH